MRFYFLSSVPCALKIGGVFYGTVNDFERFLDLSPKDNLFVEFLPVNAQPVRFFITEEIRFSPPENCEVYLLPNAVALYANHFAPLDTTLRPHVQKAFDDTLITVFSQGEVQVSLQSASGFFVRSLPPCFCDCSLSCHGDLFCLETENRLFALTKFGVPVLDEKVISYHFENDELVAVLPLLDSRNRRASVRYRLFETGVERTGFTLLFPDENGETFPDELLAYAFFESVLIGADYARFLGDSLQAKATSVKTFLGDFQAVFPAQNGNGCLLVYPKAERLYEVKPFSVETENGKIIDLKG